MRSMRESGSSEELDPIAQVVQGKEKEVEWKFSKEVDM